MRSSAPMAGASSPSCSYRTSAWSGGQCMRSGSAASHGKRVACPPSGSHVFVSDRRPPAGPCSAVGSNRDEEYPNEGPTKYELSQRADKTRPLVTVRLSVHYRVHSRQILCIGGNQIPMGWSFLSIAKVPMTWNAGDVWSCEVQLQAGLRIEHKYVILEEQDWAPLVDLDSQGVVDMVTYRTGKEPSRPPTPQTIQKQMAIVAWQPGPNRIVQVPTEEEIANLLPGQRIQRVPPRPRSDAGSDADEVLDPFKGTWEVLTTDSQGRPLLDRHDVWGWIPSAGARPADNLKGFNLPGEGGGDAGQGR